MAEHQVEETGEPALTAYEREAKGKGREGGEGEEEWVDKVLRYIRTCHNCTACRP